MIQRKSAQIMIVTLLVMMILAVVTVGVIGNVGRDVQQTVNVQQYEQAYSASEETIFKVLDKYGKSDPVSGELAGLNSISSDFASCTPTIPGSVYENCTNQQDDIITNFSVKDTVAIDGYELQKDESLTIYLQGYTGELQVTWTGSVAIDAALIYLDASGNYQIIRDVYDKHGVLSSNGGDPLIPSSNHPFNFATLSSPDTNSFRFTVSNVSGFSGTSSYLIITPRISGSSGSTTVNFNANSSFTVKQFREIIASSYLLGTTNAPTARVRTVIPLHPQGISSMEYALLVNSQVSKS